MMKKVNLCLSILFAVLLFGMVHHYIPSQLCQLEHSNLFLEDSDWFFTFLSRMGGMVDWIGFYFIQFFDRPWVGSLVFVFPVWMTCVMTAQLMKKKLKSAAQWMPLSVWVSVFQLATLYDHNFHWSGAVALLGALASLWAVSLVQKSSVRNLLFIIGIPLVAWLFGAVALVYVVGGMLLWASKKNWMMTLLLPLLIYGGMNVVSCLQGWCPSWAVAFSPLMYYEPMLAFPPYHGLSWAAVLLLLGLSRFLPSMEKQKNVVKWSIHTLSWVLPCGLFMQYAPGLRNSSNLDIWSLNHYAYTEDWDGILNFLSERSMNNYLFMNYANMALAEKGQLGNLAFHYRPRGVNALKVAANSTGSIRLLVSDVNYTVGCIAESQQHAFEAQTTFPNSLGIQTLKRLVKTNLIFGHYAVAEKYLALIGKTTFHKDWAERYSAFLYNDEAVEKDAELGEKRRFLSNSTRFCMFNGWLPDLEDLAASNPDNEKALLYLGLTYLLNKDMNGFKAFADKYYGNEDLKQWPAVFQQGLVVLLHQSGEAWENRGFSPQVMNEYKKYLNLYMQHRQRPNLKNVMNSSFGHTFWYYFMFV